MEEIRTKELAASRAAAGKPDAEALNKALEQEYAARYASEDLIHPTWESIVYLAQHESVRLLALVLNGSKVQLIVAGAGLLLSTVASVGSLY